MRARQWWASALAAVSLVISLPAWSGSIFVTGHDPIWHAGVGSNSSGAFNLATTGIEYARNGNGAKFLFVESKTTPIPPGNLRTAPFLTSALGYATSDFDVMDAADLLALSDFRTVLNGYSAIVVASDHGGMLGAAELQFLNANSAAIIDYLNNGGGLYAESESNATGQIGNTPRFAFLPFLVAATDFQSAEVANTVTAFGASLGLTNADVNGNFSHNYFASTGGMNAVDLYNGNAAFPLTLAFRGLIGPGGAVVSSPSSLALAGLAMLLLVLPRRRVVPGNH